MGQKMEQMAENVIGKGKHTQTRTKSQRSI